MKDRNEQFTKIVRNNQESVLRLDTILFVREITKSIEGGCHYERSEYAG